MKSVPGSPVSIDAYASAGIEDPSVRIRLAEWENHASSSVRLHLRSAADAAGTLFADRRSANEGTTIVFRNAARLSTGHLERLLLGRRGLGIYELDDGLPWDNGRLPGLGAWWKVPFRRDRIATSAAQAADRVIAGNETLAEWAAGINSDVRLIPSCVDVSDYQRKTDYSVAPTPRILWIGSAATEFELDAVAPALREVHRRTGARLVLFGANGRTSPDLAPLVDRVQWSLAAQRTIATTCDVGIMPLAHGPYQRAKCGYKLLQYAAAGLPSVASLVGVNIALDRAGVTIGADSLETWVEALSDCLTADPTARSRIGAQAFAGVQAWTFAAHRSTWLEAVGAEP